MEELQGYIGDLVYQVYALDGEDTLEVSRKDLHDALGLLSYMFRDYPTVLADLCNPSSA